MKFLSKKHISITALGVLLTCFTFAQNNQSLKTELAPDDVFQTRLINSNTSASDFGGYPTKNGWYFCSNDQKSSMIYRKDATTGEPLYNLLLSKGEAHTWEKAKNIENEKKFHVGSICQIPNSNHVFVTVDNREDKNANGKRTLQIYKAQMDQKGRLNNFTKLPINDPEFSTGHPTLSSDGKMMYFASDRPGGLGGVDIYRVSIGENNTFGTPINLGDKINSSGNEMFPWIDQNNMLFFASDGWKGFGGLDLFVAYPAGENWNQLTNLGNSINTTADEFAFIIDDKQNTGYFSSNRENGKGDDDIYFFSMTRSLVRNFTLEGIIADNYTGTPLPNATITLVDQNGDEIGTTKSDNDGKYSLPVSPDQNYTIKVNSEGYFPESKNIATDGIQSGEPKKQDLGIDKDPNTSLYAIIKDKKTGKNLEGVKVKITDNISGKIITDEYTGENGDLSEQIPDKKFGERVSYNFEFSKEGYMSSTQTYNDEITKEGPINIHEKIQTHLVKIDKGDDIGKLVDLNPIYFDLNKFNIRPDAALELDKIVKILNENPTMVIELGAHTDSRGGNASNLRLSDKRAKASAKYIQERISNPKRVTGKGYGESKLLNECKNGVKCSEEQHAINRRTEFVIVKM